MNHTRTPLLVVFLAMAATGSLAHAAARKPTSKEEKQRLPRTVALLLRGWENLLKRRKTHLPVDHLNVLGLAKCYQGLDHTPKPVIKQDLPQVAAATKPPVTEPTAKL